MMMGQSLRFGPAWDAPACGDSHQVPTPVGVLCLNCDEPVEDDDRGWLRGATGFGDPRYAADGVVNFYNVNGARTPFIISVIHAECDLIRMAGHVLKVCSCTGYDTSKRVNAQLLWIQQFGDS